MADKNGIDSDPLAEDGNIHCSLKKREMADNRADESESEPEFKKQKLEQLHASKSETYSETSSHIIQKLNELDIDQETHISVSDKNDNSEKNATWSPSYVGKRVHARSHDDEDDSPTNKKIKLHKQAYDHVLNAESPALSSSRTLIMQDLLDECNKSHTTAAKIVEPRSRLLPEHLYFRPTALEMATYLKQKVIGQPIEACIVPEERHDIFSIPPRDLPGYPEETHWYYYCRKPKGQAENTRSLWTRFRENTAVFDEEEKCVGIKRRFTIIEREEETNDIFLSDEEEPPVEEWFMKEISLPSSVADTDLVLCRVVLKKREKNKEEEEYYEEEEDEEEEEEDE